MFPALRIDIDIDIDIDRYITGQKRKSPTIRSGFTLGKWVRIDSRHHRRLPCGRAVTVQPDYPVHRSSLGQNRAVFSP
ncbi:hypothetical protein BWP11_15345 [Aeromonas hydrophila]|nr:hypothetical protein BWP11_15345 [Aeromonas hydrophila]